MSEADSPQWQWFDASIREANFNAWVTATSWHMDKCEQALEMQFTGDGTPE